MKTLLTEAEAWRWIAEQIAEPQYKMKDGLCYEVCLKLERAGLTDGPTRWRMMRRIDAHLTTAGYAVEGRGRPFAYFPTQEDDDMTDRRQQPAWKDVRVLLCLFFALEAEAGE